MADASTKSFSLKRWSQRKLAAAREAQPVPVAAPIVEAEPESAAATAAPSIPPGAPVDAPLPPLESLTFDSDFAPFMQAKIDEGTKRAALKKLFSDPSFNVMDGLDIYVGDYTQADPMPVGMLGKLSAVYGLLNPAPPLDVERKVPGYVPAVLGATSETAPAAASEIVRTEPAVASPAPHADGDADETAKPA
jgi:hypothetical protein